MNKAEFEFTAKYHQNMARYWRDMALHWTTQGDLLRATQCQTLAKREYDNAALDLDILLSYVPV